MTTTYTHDDWATPIGTFFQAVFPPRPGYTGYIPGKHPANVFGTTFADSNSTAMEVGSAMGI